MHARTRLWLSLLWVGCGGAASPAAIPVASAPAEATQAAAHATSPAEAAPPAPTASAEAGDEDEAREGVVTLSIVGTNDLHGHVEWLPLLGGALANLRAARAADAGGVVLLDGGDLFQGTLESNLEEGHPVVEAYEALGYDAVTVGNHEFDYGPVGPRATPGGPDDDPLGALRARIAEASFPVLSANLVRAGEEAPMGIGELASTSFVRAGVRVGVIGVTTEQTLRTTLAANVAGLALRPLADTVRREAARLREAGAAVVLLAAHAGGRCQRFDDPRDLSSCDADEEIFELARALTPGTVDAIVGGHTHQAVAHVVNETPIVESYSYGRAFGRVDLRVDRAAGRVLESRVFPPRDLCAHRPAHDADPSTCAREPYEGAEIVPDPRLVTLLAPARANAAAQREAPLGVTLSGAVRRHGDEESALGNLFTDLMLAAHPGDAALYNGGGLRADLPAGPLAYGALYEALPFDNRFATVRMTGAELAALIARAQGHGSFLSLGGVRALVRCDGTHLAASLTRADGRPIADDEPLLVVTSDFLATGGDGAFAHHERAHPGSITVEDGPPMREAMADALRARGGTLDPDLLLDRAHPRITLPGPRPVRCGH